MNEVPYGKGKISNDAIAYLTAFVSIPYGKGKDTYRKLFDYWWEMVSIPYRKGKAIEETIRNAYGAMIQSPVRINSEFRITHYELRIE